MIPSYLTILNLAWRQFVAHFDLILYGHLLFSLPLIIVGVLMKQNFPLPAQAETIADLWPNLGVVFGVDYLTTLLTLIVSVVIILGLQEALQRRPANFGTLLKSAWPIYGVAVVVSLIELVATALGTALFVLPGIVVSVLLSFALVSVVWYRTSPIKAIQHSIRMVLNNFWIVASYVLLTQLLLSVLLFIFAWGLPSGTLFNIFGSFVSTIIATYLIVFQTVLFTTTPGSAFAKASADKSENRSETKTSADADVHESIK